MEEMYSIKEVSKILGFKERSVRQWILDGKIEFDKNTTVASAQGKNKGKPGK